MKEIREDSRYHAGGGLCTVFPPVLFGAKCLGEDSELEVCQEHKRCRHGSYCRSSRKELILPAWE